jgi:YD repeat-containing protein
MRSAVTYCEGVSLVTRALCIAVVAGCAALVLVAPGSARPDDGTAPADHSGRPLTAIDASGVRVWYRYDASGALREERYADGRIVIHEDRQSGAAAAQRLLQPSESRKAP